ncbi:hypothetical protein BIW11_12335 [Tropilaelaps mercedesae]|uniref:Uncharacterized protein n=1 Tax=Tropilaelaps mercedesae TaxID=418985 RepID=A0A1V9X6T9_9ACAR|nr:hypothetical protein BIW11_12335 [Tropilaelaps mercedesae]
MNARVFILASALVALMLVMFSEPAVTQITFSKSWQAGKRALDECAQKELQSVNRVKQLITKEAIALLQCRSDPLE